MTFRTICNLKPWEVNNMESSRNQGTWLPVLLLFIPYVYISRTMADWY